MTHLKSKAPGSKRKSKNLSLRASNLLRSGKEIRDWTVLIQLGEQNSSKSASHAVQSRLLRHIAAEIENLSLLLDLKMHKLPAGSKFSLSTQLPLPSSLIISMLKGSKAVRLKDRRQTRNPPTRRPSKP